MTQCGQFYLVWFLCLTPLTGGAQTTGTEKSKLIMVLCDALTWEDLNHPNAKVLAQLAREGAVGLMNCAVPGAKTPVSAVLTLAAGQPLAADPRDELAFNALEPVSGEDGTAAEVYARRMGGTLSAALSANVNHIGWASLTQRNVSGILTGAVLHRAGVSTRVLGNADTDVPQRHAALLMLEARGTGSGQLRVARAEPSAPFGVADDVLRLAHAVVEASESFVVIQLGDLARAEAARAHLPQRSYQEARAAALRRLSIFLSIVSPEAAEHGTDILIVSPYPPSEDARNPVAWGRLTPLLAFGPHFAPGLLSSPTTRTPGLIANVDIAPTILSLFGVASPPEMTGRPMRSLNTEEGLRRMARVARLDYVSHLNGLALTAVSVPVGAFCFVLVLLPVVLFATGRRDMAKRLAWGTVFTLNLPTAFLLSPVFVPPTLLEYTLRIVAWQAALTGGCYVLARALRVCPPVSAALVIIFLVIIDICAGQPLLKDSLLSGYPLSGIRYYGVGNEYLGVLLGFAIAGGFVLLDDRGVPISSPASRLRFLLPAWWGALAILLGWPGLGANAGSLVTTCAGFGIGGMLLWGRTVRLWHVAALALTGLVIAFVFGALENALGGASSHAGAALGAASGQRGFGYLLEIALRKVAMNLHLLTAPWFLLGATVVAGTVMVARALLGQTLLMLLERRPWTARSLTAACAAGLAALVFKDSGVVTVGFLAGTMVLFILHAALTTGEVREETAP